MAEVAEHRTEEYTLELLCGNEEPKKVNFIGELCTIGTVSTADVKLTHSEALECIIDYKKNTLRVASGKIKMNGEIITTEVKIHYPCIIEAAERLFRITKTVTEIKKEKEVKRMPAYPIIRQEIVEMEEIAEHDSDGFYRSDESFSNDMKNKTYTIDGSTKDEIWENLSLSGLNMQDLPGVQENTQQIMNQFRDLVMELDGESEETDKELEPEMHSDDIKREEEERLQKMKEAECIEEESTLTAAKEDTTQTEMPCEETQIEMCQEDALESTEHVVESVVELQNLQAKEDPMQAEDTTYNMSRISIFEGIPYEPHTASEEQAAEEENIQAGARCMDTDKKEFSSNDLEKSTAEVAQEVLAQEEVPAVEETQIETPAEIAQDEDIRTTENAQDTSVNDPAPEDPKETSANTAEDLDIEQTVQENIVHELEVGQEVDNKSAVSEMPCAIDEHTLIEQSVPAEAEQPEGKTDAAIEHPADQSILNSCPVKEEPIAVCQNAQEETEENMDTSAAMERPETTVLPPSTPHRSIRRASISHQMIIQQQNSLAEKEDSLPEPKKKRKTSAKKQKKQRKGK
ncbi:hypothetical protein NEAUS04_2050 [Nematocida ausubeli]|nr:hypothetical protein NEAUS07_2138 [Nematocida ausubeli]KAI5150436.1 hypothetical protein NEAUS05_2168 [Nematocida ausubeli]KAI5164238.1 hypothetical protein NEAUS04_2050 [Nematocida ausubeli]